MYLTFSVGHHALISPEQPKSTSQCAAARSRCGLTYLLLAAVVCCCSAWTNKLITAKDHASVQLNIGHLNEEGVYTGQFTTFALAGKVRAQVRMGFYILVYEMVGCGGGGLCCASSFKQQQQLHLLLQQHMAVEWQQQKGVSSATQEQPACDNSAGWHRSSWQQLVQQQQATAATASYSSNSSCWGSSRPPPIPDDPSSEQLMLCLDMSGSTWSAAAAAARLVYQHAGRTTALSSQCLTAWHANKQPPTALFRTAP
jgi:hypothetical protein